MVGTEKRVGWTLKAGKQAKAAADAQAAKLSVQGLLGGSKASVKTSGDDGVNFVIKTAKANKAVFQVTQKIEDFVGAAAAAGINGAGQGFTFEIGWWFERMQKQLDDNQVLMLGLVAKAKSVPNTAITISCIKRKRVGGREDGTLGARVLRWRARAGSRHMDSRDMARADLLAAIEALPDAVRPFYERLEQQVQILNFIDRHCVTAMQEVRLLVANGVSVEVIADVLGQHSFDSPICGLLG